MRIAIYLFLFCRILMHGSPALSQNRQPDYFLGSKTPYRFIAETKYKTPKGYKPVFINYVGRHGARFQTSPGSEQMVNAVLREAAKDHQLTVTGERLLNMVQQLSDIERDNYEKISLLGAEEQRIIARRMQHEYPEVFKCAGLEVLMTHKIRTQESAQAFLNGLQQYSGTKDMKIIPDSLDNLLRFYDLSASYREYKTEKRIRRSLDSINQDLRTFAVVNGICGRLFLNPFVEKLTSGELNINLGNHSRTVTGLIFSECLYDLYCIQFSLTGEINRKHITRSQLDMSVAFRASELRWLEFMDGAADYLDKGAAYDPLGVQVRIAAPLLEDFIATSDKVIKNSLPPDAILRFTHAEAIAPLSTLMGFACASVASVSIFHYDQFWKPAEIIPLSANIRWIIYSNGQQFLIRMQLNERDMTIPIRTSTFPFYRWEAIKAYYEEKIAKVRQLDRLNIRTAVGIHR